MKKLFFLLTLLVAVTTGTANVQQTCGLIELEVQYFDPTTGSTPDHRGPAIVPEVSIDGYTLLFGTPCDGSVLRLLDEDGYVVYSTVIPTGTTTLPLPTTLSGEYELQIIQDGWCFYGWIEL